MTDRRWLVQPPKGGNRWVCGFGATKAARRSARSHAEKHFLNADERWQDLRPAKNPVEFLRRLADAPSGDGVGDSERRAAILDEAVQEYEDAVRRATESPKMVLLAGVGYHRPSGTPSCFARFCVVSAAGVFAAFRDERNAVSELLTAYRPCRVMWPRLPRTRDFVAAARAAFAAEVARRPGRRQDATAGRRHGSHRDES